MIPKLTQKDIRAIKEWLALGEWGMKTDCPWNVGPSDPCPDVCIKMFPRAAKEDVCPCQVYTFAHVKRTAQRAVE